MTRKNAVRVLLGMCAALSAGSQQQNNDGVTGIRFVARGGMKFRLSLDDFSNDAILVEYKGISRIISRQEIWDALENK